MTVKEIFEFLNSRFPTDTACDFDNVGILVGDENLVVTNALIALDCDMGAVNEALRNNCNLIITHHPVIFEPLKAVLSNSIVHKLIENKITVISMHTNMDMGENGVNDTLCSVLGLENLRPITASDGYLLKSGEISPVCAENLAKQIKLKLGGRIKYCDGLKLISKILVCSGSGGDFIEYAKKGGFDALITADVKHHHFLYANDNGISLFDAGHFETEDIIINPLKKLLEENFSCKFFSFHPNTIKYV